MESSEKYNMDTIAGIFRVAKLILDTKLTAVRTFWGQKEGVAGQNCTDTILEFSIQFSGLRPDGAKNIKNQFNNLKSLMLNPILYFTVF